MNSYRFLCKSVWFNMAVFVTVLFTFVMVPHVYGQYDAQDFIQYTVKEGISDNSVTCIEQDDHGFIWIGTEFGLNRYDGFQFEKYFQGSPEGFLASSNIHSIRDFSNHSLAIITQNGLQVVNTDDFSIRQFMVPDSTSFSVRLNYYRDAMELDDGTVGVASATGFYVFDKVGNLIYRHDAYKKEDVGNKHIM